MATKTRRLRAEDLWRLARPAQPTLSPDGAQVCVSVSTFDMEENKGASKLWLLSTFGGKPRPLTEAGEKDGEPRWSPDGTRIAFVAKRDKDDEPQLWLIAPDGGEARRVTRMPTGVSGIKWFPDSRRVAFISWVWPDCAGYKAHEARYKEHKDSKVKAHVVEHEAYRYWDHWLSDGRVPRLFVVDVQSQRITDLFFGTPYELPRADPSALHYDIAPDGREIAFTFDPAEEKRPDHEHHLVALDLRAKKFRMLTKGSRLDHGDPSYSPDGKWLALLARNIRRNPVAEARIVKIDRRTGRLKAFPDSWDRSVHAPLAWTGDSSALVFLAEDRARTHAFRWTLGELAPEVAALGGTRHRLRRRRERPRVRAQLDEHAAGRLLHDAGAGRGAHRRLQRRRHGRHPAGRGAGGRDPRLEGREGPDVGDLPARLRPEEANGRCCTTSTAARTRRGATTSISAGTTTPSPRRATWSCA